MDDDKALVREDTSRKSEVPFGVGISWSFVQVTPLRKSRPRLEYEAHIWRFASPLSSGKPPVCR